jgi:excisionase family DNA binding protein
MERTDSRVKNGKNMNYYDKLDDDHRAWSVCEAAHFLGYNTKYLYQLIREGKIEGWFEVNGSYRFCPAKLKAWLEKKTGKKGSNEAKLNGAADGPKSGPGSEGQNEDNRVA